MLWVGFWGYGIGGGVVVLCCGYGRVWEGVVALYNPTTPYIVYRVWLSVMLWVG